MQSKSANDDYDLTTLQKCVNNDYDTCPTPKGSRNRCRASTATSSEVLRIVMRHILAPREHGEVCYDHKLTFASRFGSTLTRQPTLPAPLVCKTPAPTTLTGLGSTSSNTANRWPAVTFLFLAMSM